MKQEHAVDFGFGCMRLPLLKADEPDSFDYEAINKLFDAFLEKGFTYFARFNSIARTTGSFSSQAVYYRNTALIHVRHTVQVPTARPNTQRRNRREKSKSTCIEKGAAA